MADEVRAKLVYDVSSAQTAVRSLGTDLDRLEKPINLTVTVNDNDLTEAVANVAVLQAEIVALAGAIVLDDSALAGAEEEIVAIDSELADLGGTIEVDDSELAAADAEVAALEADLAGLGATVEVEASGIEEAAASVGSLDAALDAATVDAAGLSSSVGAAASSVVDLGAAASIAGGELGSVAGVTGVVSSSIDSATSAVDGLVGGLGEIGVAIGLATAGLGILGVFTDTVVEKAVSAQSATERFTLILGDQAKVVEQVNIGGLDQDLASLVNSLGSGLSAVRQADASLFQLGESAGHSGDRIAETVEQVNVLAVRAVALNPSLGTVGEAAERLQSALARGGRFAANFGLSLNSTEINARAAEIALARGSETVEQFDKVAAGAAIATEKLGNSLSTDIAAGAENVEFSFRRIQLEFTKALVELGKPLISPTLDLLTTALPIGKDFAGVLGDLAVVAVPAIGRIITAIEPLVSILTDEFGEAIEELGPQVEMFADAIAEAFEDPATRDAVRDLVESLAQITKDIAPLISLFGIGLGGAIKQTAVGMSALADVIEVALIPIDQLITIGEALGITLVGIDSGLEKNRQEQEKWALEHRNGINGLNDLAVAAGEVGTEIGTAGDEAGDAAPKVADAATSFSDLGKAVRDANSALIESLTVASKFDVAVAQIDALVARQEAAKRILELQKADVLPIERIRGGFKILEDEVTNFAKIIEEQINIGEFDPAKLEVGKEQIRIYAEDVAARLGLPRETVDLFLADLEEVGRTRVRPTVELNDRATPEIPPLQSLLGALGLGVEIPVGLNDLFTPNLGGIGDAIRKLGLGVLVPVSPFISGFNALAGAEDGEIIERHTIRQLGEGNKRELVLPLEKPWERQLELLDQAGVLARLEAEFTAEEQARAASLNRAVSWPGVSGVEARPSMADLEAIASRMEAAARIIASESRPIEATITVPAIRDEHETARILRRKLVRL